MPVMGCYTSTVLQDQDTTIRKRTADCLTLVVRKAHGVKKMLQCGALPTLLDLLQDADIPVRCVVPSSQQQLVCCMAHCLMARMLSSVPGTFAWPHGHFKLAV